MPDSNIDFREHAEQLRSRLDELSLARRDDLPSTETVIGLVDCAREVLFRRLLGSGQSAGADLEAALRGLHDTLLGQVRKALSFRDSDLEPSKDLDREAREIAATFVERLSAVQEVLLSDVRAAYDGDPSLYSPDEAILCYPGVTAVICHRIANQLYNLKVPIIPRVISEYAHSLTGIDIHPGAQIGESFFIDHGTGVVIGETAVIGDRVRIYQGVTLGAKSFTKAADGRIIKGELRHPILEDDVVVYSWASILGRITIGHGSVIGGNVWVTRDVPPGTLVTQARVERSEFDHGGGI